MDTGADMASANDRLGNGGANGTRTARSGNRGTAVVGPDGSVGIVPVAAPGDDGRVEVADGAKRPQKWQSSDSIYVRLARAQDDVKTITQDATISVKTKDDKSFSYKGVSAAQIVTNAKRALIDNGIVFLPRQTRDGVVVSGNMASVFVNATFACVDGDGAFDAGGWGSGTDSSDKAISKAYTNAVKNILAKTLMMSTIDDESTEATPHEPDHKPRAIKNAEALTDSAVSSWATAYKAAIDGCRSLKALQKVRAENAPMMNNPGVPQVTKDYFIDKITALEGTLE